MKLYKLFYTLLLCCLMIFGIALTATQAQQNPGLISFNITFTNSSTGANMTLGWEFEANSNITVTSLGFFDVGSDGLLTSHEVGLWTSAGTLLGSVTVTPGSTPDGGFYYEDLASPINLTSGNSYRIAANVNGDAFVYGGDNIVTSPSIIFGPTYRGFPGFIFPVWNDGRQYLTANIGLLPLNQPPVAVCQDVTVSADENCVADVAAGQVDNGSFDPDGDDITLSLSPAGPYPLGETVVTLTVDDGQELSTCTATITVDDNTQPVVVANSDPIELWPPNHKYNTVDVSQCFVSVSDNCTALSMNDVYIASVSSDEEENAQGNGDGNTTDDIIISEDCKSVQLRKERQGRGNGRVYTITLAADDGNGNTGTTTCQVTVPHSQNGDPAVDDGAVYTVNGSCGGFAKINGEENNLRQTQQIPDSYKLDQNFPNPFNPSTVIRYAVPEDASVSLIIYDALGNQILELVNGDVAAGNHEVVFDAGNFASGIYFYRLTAGNFMQINKMLLLK
jgi:hypothetical protein